MQPTSPTSPTSPALGPDPTSPDGRLAEVTGFLAEVLTARAARAAGATGRPLFVVVDGQDSHAAAFADRLAGRLRALGGQPHRPTDEDLDAARPLSDAGDLYAGGRPKGVEARDDAGGAGAPVSRDATMVVAAGSRWRAAPPTGGWDVVVCLRAGRPQGRDGSGGDTRPGDREALGNDRDGAGGGRVVAGGGRDAPGGGRVVAGGGRDVPGDVEQDANIVVDHHDPRWPVIRWLDPDLADRERWYLPESRAFFAARAATWDTRFGDDTAAYTAAVAEAGLRPANRVLDVGCGTGRALPLLRDAVGGDGTVLGVDVTPQMLAAARDSGRGRRAVLVLADARHLPVATGSVDAIFAAGLVTHLPDPRAGLVELARVTRSGGTLVIFHPSGRAALAARHGRVPRPDEPLDRTQLGPLLAATGWHLTRYDDSPHRFLALARRSS